MGLCFSLSLTIENIGMVDVDRDRTSISKSVYNIFMTHLSHLVVVVQQADVLLLYDRDEIRQPPRQFGASISEAVHAVLNVKPGLQID